MSKQALEVLPDAGEYAFFYGPKLALLLRSVFDDTVQLLKDLDYRVTRASSLFLFTPQATSSGPPNYAADYLALPSSYKKQFEQDRCKAIAE